MPSKSRLICLPLLFTALAQADVYQWQYVDPADPAQGKQASPTPCVSGVGLTPGPDLYLDFANLANAYLPNADLRRSDAFLTNFSNADLRGADLTAANWYNADLTNADLTAALINSANLRLTGITPAQLQSTASYQSHDLTGITLSDNNLDGVDLSNQNLDGLTLVGTSLLNANFANARLTHANVSANLDTANLTGADIRWSSIGMTPAQFHSTASYQSRDLTGTQLGVLLAGENLAGFNFTAATLGGNLTAADFTSANLTAANLASTIADHVSFRNANLTSANLEYTTFDAADLTGADIRGARFSAGLPHAITPAQIRSTASYQTRDLTGTQLLRMDLTGENFSNFTLANASFEYANLTTADLHHSNLSSAFFLQANLTGANLAHANLAHADFTAANLSYADLTAAQLTDAAIDYADLSHTNLTAADTRGSVGLDTSPSITTNLIHPDGHIHGLTLTSPTPPLILRNYPGSPNPIPVTIDQQCLMTSDSLLQIILDPDEWHSTISFAPDIPVSLDGTLDLTFSPDTDPSTQLGRTFRLFDWTATQPTGTLSISSPYGWDLSNLYTTGQVTLSTLPEPATSLLLSIAIPALIRRRRTHPKFSKTIQN